jgi:hypothetical protein
VRAFLERARRGAPLPVQQRYPGRGRIAMLGFRDPGYSAGELLVLGPHLLVFLWQDLRSCSLFTRLPL